MFSESMPDLTRRALIGRGGLMIATGLILAGWPDAAPAQQQAPPQPNAPRNEKGAGEEEVAPGEDLMREHGVLRRLLLIYENQQDGLARGSGPDLPVLAGATDLIRRFIQDYHEKLEEMFVFPRCEKAGRLTDLTRVLRRQHSAGRTVTDAILDQLKGGPPRDDAARKRLAGLLGQFIRMYRPHASREDTVLFPAFREIVQGKEYEALGEQFEQREQQLFGEGGFTKIVDQVAGLERKIGLYELDQFTPQA